MTREKVVKIIADYFGTDVEKIEEILLDGDGCALLRLRHENSFLPDYGVNGVSQKSASWVWIDIDEKVDTGLYGCVYYF